jgi:hypothetical protein
MAGFSASVAIDSAFAPRRTPPSPIEGSSSLYHYLFVAHQAAVELFDHLVGFLGFPDVHEGVGVRP